MQLIAGLILGALILGLGIGTFAGVRWNEYGHKKDEIAEQKVEIRVAQKQGEVTAAAEIKAVDAQEKIVTVFKDRLIYRTKEVPVEVIKQMDSECVVPNEFVRLWDTANQAVIPNPTSTIDVSPSGIKLSDISSQKDTESEICITNTERLIGLQDWVKNQQTIPLK
jgi:hypothetical protein